MRDRPAELGALAVGDVFARESAFAYERSLIRRGQVPACGDEEGAAAHGRIEDAQREDRLGRRVVDERRERAAHEVLGQRPRRVEGTGRFAAFRADERAWRSSEAGRIEVEETLVHAAELLDAEIAIGDAFESSASLPRRQGQHGLSHDAIVERRAIGEWRVGRREEAAVERRHSQRPDAAAVMREPRDGLQRLPDPHRPRQHLDRAAQRFDRVAVAVDRMPARHEAAGFGKEQKQNPIHDDQRLVEPGDRCLRLRKTCVLSAGSRRPAPVAGRRECAREVSQCLVNPALQ